ncbi:hypothetical protein JJJ17_02055 [Paracoccus caeni]|uniref:Uncharacterized protein n=1 Tax=Paracoccus caeni TaxID=657651 RepID=A0A934SBK1_9RHOB|nr:hypothetical protein [Paracoccus caeni]MBK4214703.1 hypothetical protein [Paracoccus caeni]
MITYVVWGAIFGCTPKGETEQNFGLIRQIEIDEQFLKTPLIAVRQIA